MTRDAKTEDLDALFVQVRSDAPAPSDALLDRVMLDADAVLAEQGPVSSRARPSLATILRDLVGGWPAFGGLAAATIAGLWIGVAQPAGVADFSAGLWGGTIEVPVLESDIFAGLEG